MSLSLSSRATARTCAYLAIALTMFPALATRAQGTAPAPVVVTQATRQTLTPVTWFPGAVIARNDSRLAAEEDGLLIEVAEVGATVGKGEVVARIDDKLLEQKLVEDEAEVSREQARLALYVREVKRLTTLKSGNNVSQNQLDEAISNRAVTRSELAAARARAALTRERLQRFVVRAPFPGVVTARLMQTGEWARSGDAVVRLVDTQSLEVQTWVPASSLAFVRTGAKLRLDANPHAGVGEIRAIVPVGDDRSRLYELRLHIAETDWPAGQTLRVAVPTAASQETVAVPRDALVLRRDGMAVFRIVDGEVAERVAVQTGIAEGDLIAVSGIAPGDRVVTRGGERLRPGQKVSIVANPGAQ